jgi:hypothetical protein
MITQHQFNRHGKSYTARFGKDDTTGERTLELIPASKDGFSGQDVRLVFKSLHVERSRLGQWSIITEWHRDEHTPTGLLSPSFSRVITHVTRPEEVELFLNQFMPGTTGSILNGVVRGGSNEGDGFLGHNTQPLFDAAGAMIPDTSYDTTLAPTYDYHTPTA